MAIDIEKLKRMMEEKRRQERLERAHRPKIDIDLHLIEAMKADKLSNREIARQLHCSEGTVRNRLKELEQLRQRPCPRKEDDRAEFYRRWVKNETYYKKPYSM